MNAIVIPGAIADRFSRLGERRWVVALLGGLVFAAVFQAWYAAVNPDYYLYRDDGIITLSHARNWVDFGFIGVNPSGERLEGTSAPLQFLLYVLAYSLMHLSYQSFMVAQTAACTFALGAMFALLFADRPMFALAATAAAASGLTQLSTFMIWHASGMENALTHTFLLATLLVLQRCAVSGQIRPWWAALPFLASITRIEAIYYVAPMLLVFSIYWRWKWRDRQATTFVAAFALLWIAFNLCRLAYFGSLIPNTAVAQGISVGDRIFELVMRSPIFLDQSLGLAGNLAAYHGAYLLLLTLPFVLFRSSNERSLLLVAMAGSVIVACLFAPFLFGPARLHPARTTTQMALFVMVCIAAVLPDWKRRHGDLAAIAVVAVLVFLLHDHYSVPPMNACCTSRGFEGTRENFVALAKKEGIARPTIANPDLGAVSWHKQLNVLDLGMLGSALISHLQPGSALNDYVLAYAAPDIVETHGWWSCHYASLFTDPRFTSLYRAVDPPTPPAICKGAAVPAGIWIRRDVLRGSGSKERQLIENLASAPRVERIATELRECSSSGDASPWRCAYVARSAYRVLPELRASGAQAALEGLFAQSPSKELDLFMVRGAIDARAYQAALSFLESASPRADAAVTGK